MEATAILLDRENQEIKIYFGHTNYCVNAPLTYQNYQLYCYFNNIEKPELITIDLDKLVNKSDIDKLVSL
jgi:hypothetical protein